MTPIYLIAKQLLGYKKFTLKLLTYFGLILTYYSNVYGNMVLINIILVYLLSSNPLVESIYQSNDPKFYSIFLKHISAPNRKVSYVCRPKRIAFSYQRYNMRRGLSIAICNNAERLPKHLVDLDKITMLANLTCKYSKNILEQAKEHNMFRRSNVWLILGQVNQLIENLFISFFSQVFLIQQNGFYMEVNKIFKLTEFSKNFTLKFICKWSLLDGTFVFDNSPSVNRLTNLMGEPIRVSYAFLINESLKHLDDYRNILDDQNPKMTYRLFSEICILFNATHVPIIDEYWGDYNYSSKEYTPGMFYNVRHGLADVFGNVATISLQRLEHFRFLAPTGHLNVNELKWYFRAPSLAYTQNIWLLTFQKTLWFVILASVIVFFVITAAVVNVERCFLQQHQIDQECSWCIAWDLVITTATQRGSSIMFSTFSGRAICYSLYILTLLVYVAFSAHFFVLLQSSSNDITSFNKILETGMELGCDNYSYNIYYFVNPNDRVDEKIRQKIYKTKIQGRKDKFFLPTSEGMQLMKNGKYAFHVASTVGYFEMAKVFDEATKRSIRNIDSFIKFKMHLAVAKNSSLDDFLTAGFLYLEEAGIIQRERKNYFPERPMPDFTKAIFDSLDLTDTYFVFLVLQMGMVLSIIIFLLELALYKFKQTKIKPLRVK